jgi:hypothetical protein
MWLAHHTKLPANMQGGPSKAQAGPLLAAKKRSMATHVTSADSCTLPASPLAGFCAHQPLAGHLHGSNLGCLWKLESSLDKINTQLILYQNSSQC